MTFVFIQMAHLIYLYLCQQTGLTDSSVSAAPAGAISASAAPTTAAAVSASAAPAAAVSVSAPPAGASYVVQLHWVLLLVIGLLFSFICRWCLRNVT
jgi:hypothetical protein